MMAGHSLGEFTALVAAGYLDFKTGVDLVKYRGELMQAAVPPGFGAMAAILGLEDLDIEAACFGVAKCCQERAMRCAGPYGSEVPIRKSGTNE